MERGAKKAAKYILKKYINESIALTLIYFIGFKRWFSWVLIKHLEANILSIFLSLVCSKK